MALIVPPPAFAYCTTNLSGTPASSGISGTNVTSGSSNGVGSTVAVISAITHDVELLSISFADTFTAASVNRMLCDVFTDPAGGTSWGSAPIIPNLLCGGAPAPGSTSGFSQRYYFPIWIKSGSSIGVRLRYAHTATKQGRVRIAAYGGHAHPSQWWCGQVVTDIGTNSAASSGTSHTAGNSGAYSTWVDFGSATPSNAGFVNWAIQPQLSAQSNLGYYFEFGVAGTRIGPNIFAVTNTTEQIYIHSEPNFNFLSIPSGTQFQVRGTCGGTAEALDVAAYIIS